MGPFSSQNFIFRAGLLTGVGAPGPIPTPLKWDLNLDGRVNQADLEIVVAALGTSPPLDPRADVNGDNIADIRDLAEVAQHFGEVATFGPIEAPEGMVAWWPGDGTADDIVGTNHGTLEGGAGFADGMVGQAFSLDGDGDYVELTGASSLGLNGDFTVDAWIYVTNYSSGDEAVLGMDITPNQFNDTLHLDLRNEKLYFGFQNNDSSGNTILSTDTWYHLAWRYSESTGKQAIFVNGDLDASDLGHPAFAGTGTVYIGGPMAVTISTAS